MTGSPSATGPDAPRFSLDELRAASPVAAYRLERAYYDHMIAVARSLPRGREAADETPIVEGLVEPARPRLPLDVSDSPRVGNPDAEVSLVVVESLTQVYARRLAPRLEALRRRHGDRLALRSYTVATRAHRGSGSAAVAASCAGAQGRFWDFRALVLAGSYAGDRTSHLAFAQQLDLDAEVFAACLDSERLAAEVTARSATVRGLGMTTTPVVLVNGVYVGGAEPDGVLEAEVLAALGDGSADLAELRIDWQLTGVLLVPGSSQAVFLHRNDATSRILAEGDRLDVGLSVVGIRADHVVLETRDGLGRLSLENRAPPLPKAEPAVPAPRAVEEVRPDYASMSDRALVQENVSVLRLDRSLLRRVAARRAALESQFSAASLEMEGKRVLKLTGREHAGLMAALGLREDDVVLRVNDGWVWDGNNRLFGAIERGLPVTVVVMRKGFPILLELVEGGN